VDSGVKILILPLMYFCLWWIGIVYRKMYAKSEKILVAVIIAAATGLGILFAVGFAIEAVFLDEQYAYVQVPDQEGAFEISRVSDLPEGEQFLLYRVVGGIFREKIADSYRWHAESDKPFVNMYAITETASSSDTPVYVYDVTNNHLELYYLPI
jgi:hypothetical protein